MSRKTVVIACNGEGFGHAARAVALAPYLMEVHEIIFFAPLTIIPFIRERIQGAAIEEIPHFGFVKKDHTIDYLSTTRSAIKQIIEHIPTFGEVTKKLVDLEVDAVISDFEPVTSHAANRVGIPVVNLNHPGIVLKYFDLSVDAFLAKTVASLMMPRAQEYLLCSFYDGDIGPILRPELRTAVPTKANHLLVYTKPDSREAVLGVLKHYPEYEFRCFPNPEDSFDEALISCRGVIAPAGHQSLSEALCLQKPVLAFPQIGQYEQRLNAMMLERSGWGMAGDIRKVESSIDTFLTRIDTFPRYASDKVTFKLQDDTLYAVERLLSFIKRQKGSRKLYLPKLKLVPA